MTKPLSLVPPPALSKAQAALNELLAARDRWAPDLFVPRGADWSRTRTDWVLEDSAGGRDYVGAYPLLISPDSGDAITVIFAYAQEAHGHWCAEHRPAEFTFPLSLPGVEALRRALPLIESYPFDAEEAIACAFHGPCSLAFRRKRTSQ
ncbi:hypothetical protein [Streptomyces sp. NPDC048650]|uniref:hypothetical protein n=1 Tax=unclassified Streptomyces TaxID=2593676 RepID=UPI003721B97F